MKSLLHRLFPSLAACHPKPTTVSQKGIQARAIHHLIRYGQIDARTVLNMGTNDANKMFSRMRDMGLLFDAHDACGHLWMPNFSGSGRYKVHIWTGKLPASWAEAANDNQQK